jgi:hypothetical protein
MGGITANAGCQDDQWLVGEVVEGCGFFHRGVRWDVLVDRSAKAACGREAGAYLVSGLRRQAAEGELAVKAAQAKSAEFETSAETRPMSSTVSPLPAGVAFGFAADAGAVESTSTIPATSSG